MIMKKAMLTGMLLALIILAAHTASAQSNLISGAVTEPSASSTATAAQDFSNGFAALGITISERTAEHIIFLAYFVAKVLRKYAVKGDSGVAAKVLKIASLETPPKTP